jgi:F-box only protein C-terminal region
MKESELIEFRKLWITEVSSQPKTKDNREGLSALELWVKGNEMENSKRSVEAIKLYRMAIKLDPDVEKKYLEMERVIIRPRERVTKEEVVVHDREVSAEQMDQKSTFLLLPTEIHVQILKFLAVFDINSIFQISLCCKQMSILILKESIWRFACNFYHEVDVDREVSNFDYSFLKMWIHRPRLRYDGTYVSTIKYQREGMSDPSLRLANLKTLHVITYYRLKRFYPDHTVLIYTTSTDPEEIIPNFKKKSKLKHCLIGNWKMVEDTVIVDWNGLKNSSKLIGTLKISSTVKGLQNRLYWIGLTENNGLSQFSFPRNQLETFTFNKNSL